MVKARSHITSQGQFYFPPLTIANLVSYHKEKNVWILWEVLWFLSWWMESHLINRIFVGLDLLSDNEWSFLLKLDNLVCFLHVLANFFRVSKSVNIFQENWGIFSDILRSFSISNMIGNVFIIIRRIKFKSLAESLIVSAIPVMEASIPQFIFFFAFFLCEFYLFDSLQVTCIFGFKFFF